MTFYKSALALAISSVLSATALAQTQNIPVPASSINGGRAVVAITIPAASALPSDICTASNGNCATMAGVQQGINGGSIVIPSQQPVAPSSIGFSYSSGWGAGSYSIVGVCVQGYSGPSSFVGTFNTWTRDICPAGYGAILTAWDQFSGS